MLHLTSYLYQRLILPGIRRQARYAGSMAVHSAFVLHRATIVFVKNRLLIKQQVLRSSTDSSFISVMRIYLKRAAAPV